MTSPDHDEFIFICVDFLKQQWKLKKLCMFLLFQIWGPVVKMFIKSMLGTSYHNSAGPDQDTVAYSKSEAVLCYLTPWISF